ncbi:MAG: EAL domain-containing protein [Pseudomonadota bacterium]
MRRARQPEDTTQTEACNTVSKLALAGTVTVDGDIGELIPEALDALTHGVAIYDRNRRLCYANARYRAIYQLQAEDTLVGTRFAEIARQQARRLTKDPTLIANYITLRNQEPDGRFSGLRQLPDGRSIHVTRQAVRGGFTVSVHDDVTDRVGVEQRISHAARHDALTGLPNRTNFLDALEQALTRVRRGEQIALHLVDLDRFKNVNDTHGHSIGDKLIAAVAERMRAVVRETDIVARLGGDEFAILQIPAETASAAEALACRLSDQMTKPYVIDGKTVFSGISVGIALATPDCSDVTDLLQQADFALYRAKESGRGAFRFFEHELDRQFRERRRLEADLRRALVLDEFEVHYQPIINMAHRRVETLEALIRWERDGVWVSPGQFVPVAEETGLILPIGDWVLRRACEDATTQPEHVSVAVNVSPLQFRSGDLLDSVDRALRETGLSPERLQIEVTESVLLDRSNDILGTLTALSERGVVLALDDFGTGYSSLSYLVNFPFHKIKIDRSFVSGLPEAKEKLAILRAMSGLGLDLGISTTVEGVETEAQLSVATAEQCSEVQGFYFARPTPLLRLTDAVASAEHLASSMGEVPVPPATNRRRATPSEIAAVREALLS